MSQTITFPLSSITVDETILLLLGPGTFQTRLLLDFIPLPILTRICVSGSTQHNLRTDSDYLWQKQRKIFHKRHHLLLLLEAANDRNSLIYQGSWCWAWWNSRESDGVKGTALFGICNYPETLWHLFSSHPSAMVSTRDSRFQFSASAR
jgi:hypothetical protein